MTPNLQGATYVPLTDELPSTSTATAAGYCCFDLDNLEQIAIAAGDDAAGQVMSAARTILSQTFGADHVVRRPDFRSFYVTLENPERDAGFSKIDSVLDAICAGRGATGQVSWPITARAGVAWQSDAPEADKREMLRRASAASAAAKSGRIGRCSYSADSAPVEVRARLLCDLLAAMEQDRLKIFAQEIKALRPIDPKQRQYEVLIQVTDGAGIDHPPSEFVPLAEKSAVIEILDRWIISKALLGHAEALRARPEISLSLNLSGRSMGHADTWPFLQQTIKAAGIAPSRIQIEITETSKIGNMAQAAANVRAARAAGLGVALDDFGAGLSGFGYLTSFDVNCIKIDGALIPNVVDDCSAEAEILRSIMALANRLHFEVVAEHVSSPEILAALTRLGVCKVQGFEVGKPRLLEEVLRAD